MDKIKESLTKKIGPLPAWAWVLILFAGVWYYRNKLSGAAGTGTGSLLPANANPPQPPVVLGPGESVYDPNTNQLLGGTGDPGNSGSGQGNGGSGGSGDVPGGGDGNPPPEAPGAPVRPAPKGNHKKKRHVKKRKPRIKLKGTKRPRSETHTRDHRKQHGGHERKKTRKRGPFPQGGPPGTRPGDVEGTWAKRKGRRRARLFRVRHQHHESGRHMQARRPEAHVPPRPSNRTTTNHNRTRHVGAPPRHSRPRHHGR